MMGLFSKTICGACGCTIRGQYVKVNGGGRLLYNLCPECNQKFKMITEGKKPYPVNPNEVKELIEKGVNAAGVIEKRIRCNVCGEIFCYSDKDILRNKELKDKIYQARKFAAMNTIGGTMVASNQESARADSLESQLVDFSKCPKCNSTNLTEISEEEFQASKEKSNSAGNAAISVADEIKKFIELLDMGAISQDEFDAKKKQLLGL